MRIHNKSDNFVWVRIESRLDAWVCRSVQQAHSTKLLVIPSHPPLLLPHQTHHPFDQMPPSRSRADDKILSYGDVVLRRSDLDILHGPYYINDRLIEFYFAYLSPPHPVLLVPPSISFWLSNCPDPVSLSEAVTPLNLHQRDLVLFTVNNNSDVTAADGGTHWSLLVYYRATNEFVHHDSSQGMNRWHAETLFEAVKGFVGDDGEACYVEGFTPQQDNGYDCGLFVMTIARVVFDWFRECEAENEGERWLLALKEEVDAAAVAEFRGEVLRLILGLMEKK